MNSVYLERLTPLPSGWKAGTVGDYCEIKTGGTPSTEVPRYYYPPEIFWVKSGDVKGRRIQNPPNQISREGMSKSAAKLLPSGSVMIAMSGRGKTRGTTAVLEVEAACSQSVAAMIPSDKLESEFLHYQFAKRYDEVRNITGSDDRSGLNLALIRAIPIALPPVPEQKKIAHVLSTVQRAIEAQERIIQTTTELKKALMHKLFTEGLPRRSLGEGGPPRHEPQKQTEIGPVPESWEVVALSECAVVQTGIAKGRKVNAEEAVEVPYLRVANVQDGYLDLSEMKTITIRKNEQQRFALQDGDVVLTEGGDFDKLGRGFIWHGEIENCVHQNHVFAVRPDKEQISSEFFAYQSQSPYGKSYFLSVAHKTTNLACINTTKLKAFPVLLPPQDQQEDIVEACRSIDGKIRNATNKKNQLQDLFRTILHELMTARIRVDVC